MARIDSKQVFVLGKFPLPVEVIRFAEAIVSEKIAALGATVRSKRQQEKHMRVSPTVASSPAKVRTSPHDAFVGRQPLLNALRRHWPEYVMECVELGLYMISACAFVILLQYPTSPVHQVFP